MSLDGSLPGYLLHRREAGTVDLMNKHTRKVVYRAVYGPGPAYDCVLEDALFESPLARCTSPSAQSKEKQLELFQPDTVVAGGLQQAGRLGFTWRFTYLGETYEFRQPKLTSSKEFTLYLLRAPDPAVDLARFQITPGGSPWRGGAELSLQQYNIERFADIKDPKGLEVLLVLAFVGFWDAYEERAGGPRPDGQRVVGGASQRASTTGTGPPQQPAAAPPPPPPAPKPPKQDDGLEGWQDFEEPPNPNEVLLAHHSVATLANRAFDLLKDSSMLFVVLKARTPDEIVKGVRVVEEVGRLRLRRWEELEAGSEMHQYLVEEKVTPPPTPRPAPPPAAKQPPRTINLNDLSPPPSPLPPGPPSSSANAGPKRTPSVSQPWDKAPPQAMSIYLSKIVLPDLQPKARPSASDSAHTSPLPARNGARPSTTTTAAGRPPLSSSQQTRPQRQPPRPPPPPPAGGPSFSPQLHPSNASGPPQAAAAGSDPVAGPGADSRISRLMEGFGRLSTGRGAR